MIGVARRTGLAVLFCLGGLALTPAARAASFDCAKAAAPTDKAICKDPAVSRLDEQVAAAFKAAQALWPAGNWKTYILGEQRAWLKDRNAICKADAACLKQDYERRLTYLTSPALKWTGRYVAGVCPRDGLYLDVTPSYPQAGVEAMLYICPDTAGNVLLQAQGVVDASGRLAFGDAGCALVFTQDTVTLSAPKAERCVLMTDERVFRRDPAKSPFLGD